MLIEHGVVSGVELAVYANITNTEDLHLANRFDALVIKRNSNGLPVFPLANDYGKLAWSCYSISYAEQKLNEYVNNTRAAKNAGANRKVSC
jgi:hypothetical protein